MPSGPDGLVADPHYTSEFERARALLLAHPQRWRVIYHYDGDGIAAASCALRALQRLGYPAQATALTGVERDRVSALLAATSVPVLVVDTGASWLDLFAAHAPGVVVLDHHRYPGAPNPPPLPSHVAFVNPLDWGVDGMNELCASTLTWLYTVFLDPVNWDNAPWGLSGAIADRQHVGGFRGLNARLVEEAVHRSLLVRRPGVALFGPSVGEALAHSIDPFVRGLSGRPEAVGPFLHALGLDPGHRPGALSAEENRRLVAALKDRLAASGVVPESANVLDQERWFVPSLGLDAEEVANFQNAAGRAGVPGIGVAYALGDARAAERVRAAENDWRTGILRGLVRIENDGVNSMHFLRWFESPETTLAGTQAGLAMNYLLPPDHPVFVFSTGDPGPTKVSSRGLLRQVDRGLDLAEVCRAAADVVGGEGGGHRVASGATIPAGTRPAFLEAADRILAEQLGPSEGTGR
ncbi:MAG TPA: DHH family phosphoesterase [Thermoplasmata archaeon]|jgi:RecJ-like exonuclease|nr:DHH family phosphoesterase [Thermoplasmata archaeon]